MRIAMKHSTQRPAAVSNGALSAARFTTLAN
jgi:hypothetical protein